MALTLYSPVSTFQTSFTSASTEVLNLGLNDRRKTFLSSASSHDS
jgi:hypothetical protein